MRIEDVMRMVYWELERLWVGLVCDAIWPSRILIDGMFSIAYRKLFTASES